MSNDPFIKNLAILMYLSENDNGPKFEDLDDERKQIWKKRAVTVIVAIEKLNKMIVPKREREVAEKDFNEQVEQLTLSIEQFLEGIKTVKCPKCGGSADIKRALFPSKELAFRILEKKKNQSAG